MTYPESSLCSEQRLAALRDLLSYDEPAAFHEVGRLLDAHPEDARLHFLHGSLAAGRKDYATARDGMRRAVALAPGYAIARFQLGLLLLTSGEPVEAEVVLQPLQELGADHALHHFASGLLFLMQDRFAEAVASLEQGLERNHDNPPLNRDMRMLIGEIEARAGAELDVAPLSAAHLLLQQSALKSTKH